ncbi:MAG: hypothetical protein ACKN9W_01040 [Methylococcus sp.]
MKLRNNLVAKEQAANSVVRDSKTLLAELMGEEGIMGSLDCSQPEESQPVGAVRKLLMKKATSGERSTASCREQIAISKGLSIVTPG